MTRQRGSILVMVLLMVSALAVLVAALTSTVNQSARLAQTQEKWLRTRVMFDSALDITVARLLTDNPTSSWQADGLTHEILLGDGLISVRITRTNGLIDINLAPQELLFGLIAQFASSSQQALALSEAIIYWRQLENPETADTVESNEFGEPSRNFMSLTQLSSLPGADYDLIQAIVPFLTIYSTDGLIYPTAASRAVLASLPDISPQEVQVLATSNLNGASEESDTEAISPKFSRYLTANGNSAYIVSMVATGSGALEGRRAEATIIVDASLDSPYKTLAWEW